MTRFIRGAALLALLGSLGGGTSARAQYYPAGYAGYGWGGWAGGTVAGSTASGLGVFAAGAAQYEVAAANARALDARTAAGINEYMWESQQNVNRQYYANLAANARRLKADWNAIRQRILDDPTEADINSGDTLNAILDEISYPKVYAKTLQAAGTPLPGAAVKRIPFTYAAGGLTYSLDELIRRDNVPAIFKDPAFAARRKKVQALTAEIREAVAAREQPEHETLEQVRAELDRARATLEQRTAADSKERREGEKYLKALFGISRMLESPSYDVYLAAAGEQPTVPLRDVLMFMHSFNLRFGVARTAEDREIYSRLYAALSDLRRRVGPTGEAVVAAAEKGPKRDQRVTDFFSGMSYEHLQPPKASTPAPPPARP